MRAAGDGSEEALGALFDLHWPRAHRTAYLIVYDAPAAEDIAQEAFISAIRNLDRFDRRRPFGPWLHRIVVNRSIDWVRLRKLRREALYVDDAVESEAAGRGEAGGSECGGVSRELMDALGRLSSDQRAVVVLRYLLDHTPGEIASALDLPRGTVNSRLRRGLDQLAELYEGEG